MRTASLVLGIVGGVFAVIVSLFMIAGSMAISQGPKVASVFEQAIEAEQANQEFNMDDVEFQDNFLGVVGLIYSGWGAIILIAGVLGIVGGAVTKKHHITGGILMIVGSVITLFTFLALLSFILFLLGGIFALVSDNNSAPQAAPQVAPQAAIEGP